MVEFTQRFIPPMKGSPIGTLYTHTEPAYIAYWAPDVEIPEETTQRRALACPVALRSRLTSARPLTDQEFFEAMFG